MLAIHFGGGNIGRGFIGEVLNKNGFKIAFVDVNEEIIDALNDKHEYIIELAQEGTPQINVNNVYGINNKTHPEEVIASFEQADLITTAIGPKILPYIAPLIAKGIQKRRASHLTQPIDVIACENMIGGSAFLKEEVLKHLGKEDIDYLEQYIGFPDAAVDRIVPLQSHEDKLFVSVEGYKEWVIDESKLKNPALHLDGVHYAAALEPFIERKLFTVNTGHAATAYVGKYEGYKTIDEALKDETVKKQVEKVLAETGGLMVNKWQFDAKEHQAYITKILSRFANPYISDDITRVARTPMRKLGYDERFIRPIREANERGLETDHLIQTVAKALVYRDVNDEESQQLENLLKNESVEAVIRKVTQLEDETLIEKIVKEYTQVNKK
ncbi:mannitol-1-phosphate 5-dehydrogenase [Carnobacterium alterfunditum]|uniref:mannitol-1-phosphate 5-dehydrogenase n=1 Tax=Carnobacterium alterfunditum TaxID=28230 RepID=UPI0035940B47